MYIYIYIIYIAFNDEQFIHETPPGLKKRHHACPSHHRWSIFFVAGPMGGLVWRKWGHLWMVDVLILTFHFLKNSIVFFSEVW